MGLNIRHGSKLIFLIKGMPAILTKLNLGNYKLRLLKNLDFRAQVLTAIPYFQF